MRGSKINVGEVISSSVFDQAILTIPDLVTGFTQTVSIGHLTWTGGLRGGHTGGVVGGRVPHCEGWEWGGVHGRERVHPAGMVTLSHAHLLLMGEPKPDEH